MDKNIMTLIKKYPLVSKYEYDEADIFIEYDNYLCIIQTNSCDNILFLKLDDNHVNSLKKDVDYIIEYAITNYNKTLFLLRNKKWKLLLNNELIKLLYENEEYCIYGKKDLY